MSRKGRYQFAVEYLYSLLPMYQKQGKAALTEDLNTIKALCEAFGNPQERFPAIHIAGTNGKGSTANLISGALQAHGLKVGLYTSPHYIDFRERMRINGKEPSKRTVINFIEDHKAVIEEIKPSFFEFTTAMAFWLFAKKKVNVAVIETGLGGRLDATNILTPLVSVITNISMDHQDILGGTISKIAAEKAGIIKPEVPVVIGEYSSKTKSVFEGVAKKQNAPLHYASKMYELIALKDTLKHNVYKVEKNGEEIYSQLKVNLKGSYQDKNTITALAALEVLKDLNHKKIKIKPDYIALGFENLTALTGIMGRWQIIDEKPLVVCDCAHNEGGMQEVKTQLKEMDYENLHIILGMVKDKNHEQVLKYLPKKAKYYFVEPDIPRALMARKLREKAEAIGYEGRHYLSVKNALKSAHFWAKKDDLILITGSSYIVGEALK